MKKTFLLFGMALSAISYKASAFSERVYGGPSSVQRVEKTAVVVDMNDVLYIGPGTHVIDGEWQIYASRVLIDPSAIITGSGTMAFYAPVSGASATYIDDNSSTHAIEVLVSIHNSMGIVLEDMTFPEELLAAGFSNNAAMASLYIGQDVALAVDGAHIELASSVEGHLRFSENGHISNYGPERMIITGINNSFSHVIKEAFTTKFTFPIGVANGDYTPVAISNEQKQTVHVSVQDYAFRNSTGASKRAFVSSELNDGMGRIWHIYGEHSGIPSHLSLQHNTASNQGAFSETAHFVSQWSGHLPNTSGDIVSAPIVSSWQTNTAVKGRIGDLSTNGLVSGSSICSRNYKEGLATKADMPEGYFTKLSVATTNHIEAAVISSSSAIVGYPNPTDGLVKLSGLGDRILSTINVMDLNGKLIRQFNTQNSTELLDLSALPAATYIIQIKQEAHEPVLLKIVRQ